MTSDTTEQGLETLIVASLTGEAGYRPGDFQDFDRDHAVDLPKLLEFIQATQPEKFQDLNLAQEGTSRQRFLHRLQGQIANRGIIDVLRNGVKHGPNEVDLFYKIPTPGNQTAARLHAANIFSVTRRSGFLNLARWCHR